jgi:hypothetical protein
MAWDSNGMYYRSRRKGKKVTREYFGNGEAARLAAALDDRKRRRNLEQIAAVKALRRRWDEVNKPLELLERYREPRRHIQELAGYVRLIRRVNRGVHAAARHLGA